MANFNCGCNGKHVCTLAGVVASIILGIVGLILQITGTITVTPVFLWVVFGIAIVYLTVLVIAAVSAHRTDGDGCLYTALNPLLIGILGSALVSTVLLGIGIVATSVLSAILVGVLFFFFSLMITSAACLVRCLAYRAS